MKTENLQHVEARETLYDLLIPSQRMNFDRNGVLNLNHHRKVYDYSNMEDHSLRITAY